ncbi:MAG: hypothetical protein PHR47_02015 [Candidatus Pacebacteria bacterium]|nr:hypothetical protein [Candidatus Paceibacterota bacterium]
MENNNTQCCPEFKPELFDGKEFFWQDKTFIKDEVIQFMHMPLNMGSVVTRMWNKIKKAEANPADQDFLMLCYDPSPWKSEIYMTTTKIIPNATNVTLSGNFLTKVFDGPYQDIPKFVKQMEMHVASKGKSISKMYFHYAYCPKCAKKYGHNYIICFAQT